ncbi:MAG: glycerophosphodiester phosphodiesterase [Promethearchaeota archaeon]
MSEAEKMLIIAHRGASSIAPENTLKAFKKAIELGADYIEFDVHKSLDGEIVIMHDANTFRTTGHNGEIKEMTLKELKKLDCGGGQSIPTLSELVKIAKGKINLNCEVKATGLTEQLISILRENNLLSSTIISSFNHENLLKIQKLEPQIKLAPLEPTIAWGIDNDLSWKEAIEKAKINNFYAINPLFRLINQSVIDEVHKNDLKIFPWTVNSKSRILKLINLGVDGIITNEVERVNKLLNKQY